MQLKLSVYGILIDGENRILLQKRANTKYAEGWWSLPGGHVEEGESIENAVRREIREELGVEAIDCRFLLTLARKPEREQRYINFFFAISSWTGVPKIAENKASELLFCPAGQWPEPTLPYIQEALLLIERGIQFHELIR